jgi:hypothetical protein
MKRARTPFQDKYKKMYKSYWEGGKEDDITVVVGICVHSTQK